MGGVDWDLFLVLLCLAEDEVESPTFFWLKIRPGLIWPQVGNLPSNGRLEQSKPKGKLPHENLVFQLPRVGEPVKKIVIKENGGCYITGGYFSSRNSGG